MNDNTYNGWTNYQTWAAKLWIDNDQSSQEYWLERATECLSDNEGDTDAARYDLANELQSQHEEFMPEVSGIYADLMQSALGLIDWREIASSLIEDAQELAA
jgi:hypothetical protein